MSKKLLFAIGTRPELIKLFPIINYLKKIGYKDYSIVSTGQHKDLLKSYWEVFDIVPDYELNIISPGQSLSQLTAKAILAMDDLLTSFSSSEKPEIIISQGDTTTVMASSIVAFYHKIEFAHIEAGLRSNDMYHPFPEELNRKVAGICANYHFAPTEIARLNLLKENTSENDIHVVGNTVIDTLQYFISSNILNAYQFKNLHLKTALQNFDEKSVVLITCHRRENHNRISSLIETIGELSKSNPNLKFVWPVHPNPNVLNFVLDSEIKNYDNVIITEPLEYLDLIKTLSLCKMAISDSGGIQEEAPTFHVPVLVLRETTERPEAINMGLSKLIPIDKANLIKEFNEFNPIFSEDFVNPYGDGKAAERVVDRLLI